MWKVIREFVPSKDSEKPVYQKDHKILANEFNEYFASVGKATADKVKKLAEENNIQITTTLPPVTTDPLIICMSLEQLHL